MTVGIQKPFKRNVRAFVDDEYSEGGRWMYIIHAEYALAREQYIRAYLLIQKDLQELFDYIEPSDQNLKTYSYRIHALLVRVCIEIEANCKAILTENTYSRTVSHLNINDYKLINHTHRLSSYEVILPGWHGKKSARKPFAAWAKNQSIDWYKVYNQTKHNRHTHFQEATFDVLIDAITGLVVLLAAQFQDNDDTSGEGYLLTNVLPGDGTERTLGGLFRIRYPADWPNHERYNFDWQTMKNEKDPFTKINYDAMKPAVPRIAE